MNIENLKVRSIDWISSALDPYIFETIIDGEKVMLRLNDFPEENIATLIFQDSQIEIEEFPSNWTLPKHRNSYDTK